MTRTLHRTHKRLTYNPPVTVILYIVTHHHHQPPPYCHQQQTVCWCGVQTQFSLIPTLVSQTQHIYVYIYSSSWVPFSLVAQLKANCGHRHRQSDSTHFWAHMFLIHCTLYILLYVVFTIIIISLPFANCRKVILCASMLFARNVQEHAWTPTARRAPHLIVCTQGGGVLWPPYQTIIVDDDYAETARLLLFIRFGKYVTVIWLIWAEPGVTGRTR